MVNELQIKKMQHNIQSKGDSALDVALISVIGVGFVLLTASLRHRCHDNYIFEKIQLNKKKSTGKIMKQIHFPYAL